MVVIFYLITFMLEMINDDLKFCGDVSYAVMWVLGINFCLKYSFARLRVVGFSVSRDLSVHIN